MTWYETILKRAEIDENDLLDFCESKKMSLDLVSSRLGSDTQINKTWLKKQIKEIQLNKERTKKGGNK